MLRAHVFWKIVLPVIMTIAITIPLIVFVSYTYQHDFLANQLTKKGEIFSKYIENIAQTDLVAYNISHLQMMIASLAKIDRDMKYAMVMDTSGNVISDTRSGMVGKTLTSAFDKSALKISKFTVRPNPEKKDIIEMVMPVLQNGTILGIVRIGMSKSAMNSHLMQISTIILLIGLIALAVAIAVIYYILRITIRKPIDKLVKSTQRISSGDLTERIEVKRRDEIGRIAKALNDIVDSVRDNVKNTKRFMDNVTKIGDDIGQFAKQASVKMQNAKDTLNTAKGSVDSTVSAIEEINAGIEEIASASQETAKNAQQADEQMSKMNELQQMGKKNTREAAEKIENIKSMTDKTVEAVNKLQSSSQEIGAIVDTINSIAEQTNLLALNAAIEAARAGEAGKGFAVVAEEIRNLAEETKKATMNIGELIEGIQEDTNDAVKVMNDTTKAVEEGTEAMDEVTKGLEEILEAVSKTSGMIQNIASMAEEQSASTEEIASGIDSIAKSANDITAKMDTLEKVAGEQAEATRGFVKESEELTRALEELKKSLDKFKV